MATYIPNATQTTEPVESRTVESAALEFRTLKTSINARIEDVQDGLDTEIVNRIAGDANLQTQNNAQDVRLQAIEAALLVIGEGGLPGTVYVQRLSGTGAQISFTLNVSVPSSALIDVFINGIYQNKNTFTIVDDVLTFSEAPPAGTDNVEVVVSITIANVETDASLVSFRATDSTVVVRTAQDKMREVVSVKDFGALGDGTTNDTAAIQAALSSGKYQIYFPAGTYLVSGTLTAFSNGMILRGDGMVRTVIKQTNAALSTPTLRTDPANSRLFAFEISDLRIEQPDGATNTALQINNPNFRCVVERVRVDCGSGASSSGTAIHIKRASDATDGYFTTIHNCWVDKHAYGIWIEGAAPGSANVHWITQTTVTSAASFGVWIKNAGSVYVSHGHIELCGTGVYGESVGNLVVDKNYFERNSNFDVDLLSGNSCLVEGNQHNSSAYANASGSAIRLQAGEHHRIRDNWFNERFSSYDVRISAGVNNTSIIGNVAKARDINGGWKSSGPVVEDNGTATFYANTQYTPGGARRFLFDGPAVHDAPELTRPLISRVNGSDPMPEILSGSSNPTSGVAAPVGTAYLRTGASPGFWVKTGSLDADWTNVFVPPQRVNGTDPNPSILSGSNNPSVAPGVVANIGSIYLRNGAFPGFWQKTSSADTGWEQIT